MSHNKLALKLLEKADQDFAVFKKLRFDKDIAEKILGFHAQQAVEKMLKAILAEKEINFPYTHRISDLIYDFYEEEEEPFDFKSTYVLMGKMRNWVETI